MTSKNPQRFGNLFLCKTYIWIPFSTIYRLPTYNKYVAFSGIFRARRRSYKLPYYTENVC